MHKQEMNAEAIHKILAESQAGNLIFPEVVGRMLAAGVESYFVDVPRAEDVVYLRDGTALTVKMHLQLDVVAEEFSEEGIVAAIGAAQRDEIRYPEFMRKSCAAGVTAYWAFLTGKKVIYFGRKGEFHEEYFPGAK
ncbi:MAG: DUF1398 family protein [Terracidiphilus sp.]